MPSAEQLKLTFYVIADSLKYCYRFLAVALSMKSKINALKKALSDGDYNLSESILIGIEESVIAIEKDAYYQNFDTKYLLKGHLKDIRNKLSKLKKELLVDSNLMISEGLNINQFNRKAEISKRITEISASLKRILDDQTRCLIALDEDPVELI